LIFDLKKWGLQKYGFSILLEVEYSLDMMKKKDENVIRRDEQMLASANNDKRVFKNSKESFN
jgi:hypothetical protein